MIEFVIGTHVDTGEILRTFNRVPDANGMIPVYYSDKNEYGIIPEAKFKHSFDYFDEKTKSTHTVDNLVIEYIAHIKV
jgi:hypothetical protein